MGVKPKFAPSAFRCFPPNRQIDPEREMNRTLPKFASAKDAAELQVRLSEDFAVVENPDYIFPPYELYPLAQKATELSSGMTGAVMDMDGTTTTTETLCIHSLETMVRRITARETDSG